MVNETSFQAGLFSLAAPFLLGGAGKAVGGPGIPWASLGVLGLGVAAIAVANVLTSPPVAIALVVIGLVILALVVLLDDRMRVRLLPHRAGDVTTVVGAGYAAMFALTAASMGFSIYGPPILQQTIHGARKITPGAVRHLKLIKLLIIGDPRCQCLRAAITAINCQQQQRNQRQRGQGGELACKN